MATATIGDERVAHTSTLAKVMKRPEIGALVAAIVIFVFFAVTTEAFATASGASTWLRGASTIGIMAVAVALLMIGGEFDLSAGAMTGFTGLVVGVLTTEYGLNIWVAILVSLASGAVDRGGQRHLGDADGPAQLHRHARDVLRPAGHRPGRHQGADRAGRDPGHVERPVLRPGQEDLRLVDRHQRVRGRRSDLRLGVLVDRRHRGRDLGAAAHPHRQLDLRGRRCSRPPPGRSACRCSRPRSACS